MKIETLSSSLQVIGSNYKVNMSHLDLVRLFQISFLIPFVNIIILLQYENVQFKRLQLIINKMSTYKAEFKYLVNQGLSIHFQQDNSQVIIKCSKPSPCNFPESQTGLYLDISLRQSSKDKHNWLSFENNLKQLFEQLVQLENYPNSTTKIFIFIIEQGKQIKSCAVNGLWLLLLKMGINMKKSIYCWQQKQPENVTKSYNQIQIQRSIQKSAQQRVIYNLNDIESIIQGEVSVQRLSKRQTDQQAICGEIQKFKCFVLQGMSQNMYS